MASGGHNKMYEDDSTCEYEVCNRKPWSRGRCETHYAQFKTYGHMWPIGEKRPNTSNKNGGFSLTTICDYCQEEKYWKKFVLGMEGRRHICTECYRNRQKIEEGEDTQAKQRYEDFLDFLDSKVSQKSVTEE